MKDAADRPGDPIEEFEASVAARQADLDEGIERGRLGGDPYRHLLEVYRDSLGLFPVLARLLARPPQAISDEQWAGAWAQIRAMAVPIDRLRVALSVAAGVGLLAIGLAAGYALGRNTPVATPFGPWPADLVEAVRANDMTSNWALCQEQPARQGREWCKMPMWRTATPPPK